MKKRGFAAFLAIVAGGAGVHWFYLRRYWRGFVYLLFMWTFIPFIVGIAEGVYFLTYDTKEWDDKFNPEQALKSDTNEQQADSKKLSCTN